MTSKARNRIAIVIPVYNDWDSVLKLLPLLDRGLRVGSAGETAEVVLIDDGSTTPPPEEWDSLDLEVIAEITILELRCNLGHQRALAIGFSYVEEALSCEEIVVMDADGEDDPRDVPRLLAELREIDHRRVVFAARLKRSESMAFKVGYAVYRALHRVLTGIPVRVGNFSAMPRRILTQLVVVPDLWNHYAASVFRARLPTTSIPTERASRLCGVSSMNVEALVTHGLSAISVFADRVGTRLLIFCVGLWGAGILAAFTLLISRILSASPLPSWLMRVAGTSFSILLQATILLAVFVFVVLGGRGASVFLPARDHRLFISAVHLVRSTRNV